MFNLRSPLILGAVPAGTVLAVLAWIGLGGGASVIRPLDRMARRLDALRPAPRRGPGDAGDAAVALALAMPVFPQTSGPGAVVDPVIALSGVAIAPRGRSALIAVDGKPAAWLDEGASRDGVTLINVSATKIVVDTAIGFKDVALGSQTSPSTASAGGAAPPTASQRSPPGG